ncbi:MAG: hypothetical protein ACK41T_02000 [Pseudobdellovibrio sp.]
MSTDKKTLNKKLVTVVSLITLVSVTLFSFQNCGQKQSRSIDQAAKQEFLEERKMFSDK